LGNDLSRQVKLAQKHFDVLIIGGGVIGASIAYHLLQDGLDGTVGILEKDPSYEFASTPRSLGGIRQQFSTEVNIKACLYSVAAFERFDEEMTVDGEPAHCAFRATGYLLLGDKNNWETLKRQYTLQRSLGVDVKILTSDDLLKLYPQMNVADITGGSLGRRAGYLDAYSVMRGYLRKARSLGARYLKAEVQKIVRDGQKVTTVKTTDGKMLSAGAMVLCAGAWSGEIAKAMGLELPVIPSPKMAFHVDPAEKFDYDLPFIFNPDGSWFRQESGQQIICGLDRGDTPGFTFDWDRDYFKDELWPRLYNRFKTFDRLKLMRGWSGLYAVNTLDHNALLGVYPGMENFYVATGFSGHGLMQSPAAGKGLSELIRNGRYDTVDLSPLSVERIFTKKLVVEEAVY
jgi:glycine/D-amino acid oxidase-like deaminating enzyme